MISSERRALLVAASGAPLLPPGRSGSISHKGPFIVALAAATSGGVGVDLERVESRDIGLQRKVLTSAERERLLQDDQDATQSVVMHFSVKEAVYKALDPTDQQDLEFDDIETILPTATPRLWLPVDVRLPGRPLLVRAALLFDGDWIIATAMREPN
jgi:4'-phosphopantetheinyl transferase EntD